MTFAQVFHECHLPVMIVGHHVPSPSIRKDGTSLAAATLAGFFYSAQNSPVALLALRDNRVLDRTGEPH